MHLSTLYTLTAKHHALKTRMMLDNDGGEIRPQNPIKNDPTEAQTIKDLETQAEVIPQKAESVVCTLPHIP